jgi:membrane associated rhomboid family serine protease
MFFPVGDEPNPPGIPVATWSLIAANVAVFVFVTLPLGFQAPDPADPLLPEYISIITQNLPGAPVDQILRQVTAYDLFVFRWGYRPIEPSVLTLFSAMFLHGGFMHLFGNMLFLWIYGDNVEHRLGIFPFIAWYLATGAAATLFHALFASASPIPLVGASGAISGVLGFYFVWFPHNQVRLWVVLFPFFMNAFLAPARWVLGFYLIIDNLLPFFLTSSAGGGVAYGAHIGGFVGGVAVALFMNRREVTERPEEYRSESKVGRSTSARDNIASLMKGREYEKASEAYFSLPYGSTHGVLSSDDSIALGNWLARNGHAKAALTVYQRHIRDFPRGPGLAEAHAYAGLVQLHAFRETTAAYQHLVQALEHRPEPELETMIRSGLAEIAARMRPRGSRRFH